MTREIKLPEAGDIYKNHRGERYVCTGHRIDGFMTKFYRMVRINQNSSYDIEIAMPLFAKCFELETHPESIEELKAIINLQQKQLKIEQKENKELRKALTKIRDQYCDSGCARKDIAEEIVGNQFENPELMEGNNG